jgi:hypothetical protein
MTKDPKSPARKPAAARRGAEKANLSFPLLFTRQNYYFMFIGMGLIAVGLLLMLGGGMEDPNVWDESVIYSARRTVLAPIVILAGLAVEAYAILRK